MQCFSWLVLLAVAVFVMVSLLRWFEQTSEAVERREWNRVWLLVLMPFVVWFYPSKVSAGRPTAVPRHEPVRGFGSMPKAPARPLEETERPAAEAEGLAAPLADGPPPGTPKEFLELPKVPPPKPRGKSSSVDLDRIAKLRQKMREQGMLPPAPPDEE